VFIIDNNKEGSNDKENFLVLQKLAQARRAQQEPSLRGQATVVSTSLKFNKQQSLDVSQPQVSSSENTDPKIYSTLALVGLLRSPQLSNQEATEGRVLEIAGIGAGRLLSGPDAGYFHPWRGRGGAYKAQTPLTAIGRARSRVVTQPHSR
jgi:hypothetical protein